MNEPNQSPDWPIYQEIMEAVSLYTGLTGCRNERFERFPYPQRTYILSDMMKLHVLRECGDIKKYLKMESAMAALPGRKQNKHDVLIQTMMEWLDKEMDGMRPVKTVSTREKIVISMLIWGKEYVNKMLGSTFKSMMAGGNLPALASQKFVIIHFQTDATTRDVIEQSPIAQKMKELGVNFSYSIIPDDLIPLLIGEQATYWMVGAGATLGICFAKKCGAAFHHSYPDIIYSDKYFSELVRLAKVHNSILGPAHRADEALFIPTLESYSSDEAISVPSRDLIALHFNTLHMSSYPCMVNNRPAFWKYPQNHVMMWEAESCIHFNCPHLNALWLSYAVIKDLPDRYFMSLDSELDLICKGEDFYIPQETDELYLVEFSESGRYAVNDMWGSASDVGNFIWGTITHRDLAKFFYRGMKVAINREIRPAPANAFSDIQVSAEKTFLANAIQSTDHYANVALARKRSHEGRIFAFVA